MHRHEIGIDGAAGQFPLHIGFAASQHHRSQTLVQLIQISVADGAALFIQLVIFSVETEQGAEQLRIEKLGDGVDFVDTILQRRPGQYEGIGAFQVLDGVGGFGLPILDALRLVQDDDIRFQQVVDLLCIRANLLVAGNGKEKVPLVLPQATGARPLNDPGGQIGELTDLIFPLPFERV